MSAVEAIRYKNRKLSLLDQVLLPQQVVYVDINSVQDGYDAIKTMKVRGMIFNFFSSIFYDIVVLYAFKFFVEYFLYDFVVLYGLVVYLHSWVKYFGQALVFLFFKRFLLVFCYFHFGRKAEVLGYNAMRF